MSEQPFQSYFLKTVPHGYRTALINGGGFPDTILDHGDYHSFVELKEMPIGPSGDRKLKALFKKTQGPWYARYLAKGGKRLFVLFKVVREEGNEYGLLHMDMGVVRALEDIKYSDLKDHNYSEYKTLKELIDENFQTT